jgi:hypothetical protein
MEFGHCIIWNRSLQVSKCLSNIDDGAATQEPKIGLSSVINEGLPGWKDDTEKLVIEW